jgi:hypothetical protein
MMRRRGLLRHAWREIRARRGPAAGVATAVIVGVTGFTVLTTSSQTQRLQTVGAVEAASHQTFDLLVRPRGSRSEVEKRERVVQPGYLNGLRGISMEQLAAIRGLSDVAVAAPVAVLGYVTPYVYLPVDLTPYASRRRPDAFGVDADWRLPDGSALRARPQYTVTTPASVGVTGVPPTGGACGSSRYIPLAGWTVTTRPPEVVCPTRPDPPLLSGGALPKGHVAYQVPVTIPILVAAVDPAAERRLLDLEGAASPGALDRLDTAPADGDRRIPTLLSTHTPVDFEIDYALRKLPPAAASAVLAGRDVRTLAHQDGQVVGRRTVTACELYDRLLHKLATYADGPRWAVGTFQFWSTSGLDLREKQGRLVPVGREPDVRGLWTDPNPSSIAPAGTDDLWFREVTAHNRRRIDSRDSLGPEPLVVSVGTFDPDTLMSGMDDVSRILAGYAAAPTVDREGRQIAVTPNIASVVQAPPTAIVDIRSMSRLVEGWTGTTVTAPLSAIRIKVKGVSGVDDLSRERVRLAAERIRKATGLDVDVTVGSSTTTKTIEVPRGRFGRPPQEVTQTWAKLGVATQVLDAVDKKSIILFVLVLLVAMITTANSVIASVRSRRTEIGVLSSLGWRRTAILRLLLTELAILAVGSGGLAFLASLGVARLAGVDLGLGRAALSLPAAITVVLLAGLAPALAATRIPPLGAVHPAVAAPRRPGVVRTVLALAWTNVRRVPTRSLLAASCLALATATFTLLLAVAVGFQGAVVGSVLGDAVAVQARGADYAAALATLALAGIGMANVTYLNIRDRSVELATLLSLGWTPRRGQALLAAEAGLIGAIGGVVGALVGYGGAWLLFGALPGRVVLAALAAVLTSMLISTGAALATATRLGALPLTVLLTE